MEILIGSLLTLQLVIAFRIDPPRFVLAQWFFFFRELHEHKCHVQWANRWERIKLLSRLFVTLQSTRIVWKIIPFRANNRNCFSKKNPALEFLFFQYCLFSFFLFLFFLFLSLSTLSGVLLFFRNIFAISFLQFVLFYNDFISLQALCVFSLVFY